MVKEEFIEWGHEIQRILPDFLYSMQVKNHPEKYKYSFSGDILNNRLNWGLGNNVFALRIWYHINKTPNNFKDSFRYIQSFQNKNGEFFDPYLNYISIPMAFYDTIKYRNLSVFSYRKKVKRAETRQTLSLFKLYNQKARYNYTKFPQTIEEINDYLSNLDWTTPWGAGSHFSALIFFLSNSQIENKLDFIDFAINWVNKLQKDDGCWYEGNPPLYTKVNGAMKYFTALKSATEIAKYNHGKIHIEKAEKLIDTALLATNDKNSCDNFNLSYTLKYASEITDNSYRYKEIEKFIENRLDIYKKYYYAEHGGFSFFPNKANTFYYGAPLSLGKNEPDIHGTAMFVWGISVIANFWGLAKELNFREHTP